MADKENTEVPPASEAPAPVTTAAPVTVVRERGSWVTPLIAALVVVVTLVVGGVGGFALAAATHAGARPALQQGQFPGPAEQGGPQQGPGGQQGDRPNLPSDRPEESDEPSDETEEDDSTEG